MAKKKDESEAIGNQLNFAVKELNAVAERLRAAEAKADAKAAARTQKAEAKARRRDWRS